MTKPRFAMGMLALCAAMFFGTSLASAGWTESPEISPGGNNTWNQVAYSCGFLGLTWSVNNVANKPHVPLSQCSGSQQQGYYWMGVNAGEWNWTTPCPSGQTLQHGHVFVFL